MHEVIRETSGNVPIAVLSGPSHAEEVARDQPSLVVAANESIDVAETVQAAFNSDAFRVYTSQDVLGVELGGSLKNVMAIAAGICDGFELGDNARAALITRGLAEMSRLGADLATFAGLSGMGDLIVTCSSRHSRNHALGQRLAEGMSVEEALAASPMVAEGVNTAQSANALAKREGVEMPIAHQVYRVLYEGADAQKAIADLMLRDPRPERG
jgi:glycerol-3-phosphate dehydrogenase (NAD(P)+)